MAVRDKRIGNSVYSICNNRNGKWYISEIYDDGVDFSIANGYYTDNIKDIENIFNNIKEENMLTLPMAI